MKVLSLDIGLRNMGVVFFDSATKHLAWQLVDLFVTTPKAREQRDYCLMTHRMMKKYEELFDDADHILLERQMQSRMRVIAASIRSRYFDKTKMIAPILVKRHFATSRGNHSDNKKAAINFVMSKYAIAKDPRFLKLRKRDDVADALLQADYFLAQSSRST